MKWLGLMMAFGVITLSLVWGGDIGVSIKALSGVLLGTLAAGMVLTPARDVKHVFHAMWLAFARHERTTEDTVHEIIHLGRVARRKGALAMTRQRFSNPYMEKACNLVAENAPEGRIHRALQIEIDHLVLRHKRIQSLIRSLGIYAPSFGLIGTVMSLILVMKSGAGLVSVESAVHLALTTTLYGALLSFSVLNPIANRLAYRTVSEVSDMELIREGLISIMNNENTTHISEHVSSALPTSTRRLSLTKHRADQADEVTA